MAIKKRSKVWYIYFRPFKGQKVPVWVSTGSPLKTVAEDMERQILAACRSGDYRSLSPDTRAVCVGMFRNHRWTIPEDLSGETAAEIPAEELTLWRAIELCLKYPGVRTSPNRARIEQCFYHLVEFFGKNRPIKSIWIPQIREYQVERLNAGAAPATINKEKACLSKVFQVLVELQHVTSNPAREVDPLSEKLFKRNVYISFQDFQRILGVVSDWYSRIVQTAYYTGMRRGEILGLTWRRVNLARRLIYLGPESVKEKRWKRVPIHRDLVPILEGIKTDQIVGLDSVFLHNGEPVVHPHQVRWCWDRNVARLEGLDPAPHFHDLRHTWKTNARRSGIDQEIREAIMGHALRGQSVSEGYGRISDEELINAIDLMTFDHGETEIMVMDQQKTPKSSSSRASVKIAIAK